MIKALSFTGYSSSEIAIKQAGLSLLNIGIWDPDFEQAWLAQVCTETKGMTQDYILRLLRADQGVEFRAYRKWWSKVIGYFISGDILWDNLKYVDGFTPTESGSNDGHEILHMNGLTHNGVWDTSAPYTFNRVFVAWAARYLARVVPVDSPQEVLQQ